MKRLLSVFIFVIAFLFLLPSHINPVSAACSGYCAPAREGCSCWGTGTCSAGWVCCKTCPTTKPTKKPDPTSPPVYTCDGYCAPTGNCDTDTCGSGTCASGRVCCGVCASCGGLYESCCAGSCDSGLYCRNIDGGTCYRIPSTAAPTEPPAPEPTIAARQNCAGQEGDKICQGNASYSCNLEGSSYVWELSQTCFYNCPGSTTVRCNDVSGTCCAQGGTYCTTDGPGGCTPCASCGYPTCSYVYCYASYAAWLENRYSGSSNCVNNTTCGCTSLTDTCGGDAYNCPALTGDPNSVSHINNCNDVYCGPPCEPPPAGGCTADCSNAVNVCFGQSFSDGCTGTCNGIKACVGTLTARAVAVTASTTNCNDITASSNYLAGTTISFNPAVSPASQTQGAGVLTWNNISTDGTSVYTVQGVPPPQNALGTICVSQNNGAWIQNASGTLTDGGTLAYAIGYVSQAGWFQSTIGNVYAGTQLTASIPATATNPYCSLAGGGGTAGVVSYGTGYDFSLSASDLGETQVSPAGWLAKQTNASIDYYERFNQKLTNATKTALTTNLESLTKPACATAPCIFTVDGNLQTAAGSPWTIGATEQMVLLVNGNVTINANITVASGGFFTLIVNGNVTVNPAVTTLDGLYVATNSTHSAVFASGSGAVQLVVHGSVIADVFSLQRNLDALNSTTPAEVFVFAPELLFTMPDELKETPYVWQEVAP